MDNFVINKLAIEAQTKPAIKFFKNFTDIASPLWNDEYLPHWETDGKRIMLKNDNTRELCLLEFKRILYIRELFEDEHLIDKSVDKFSIAIEEYFKNLPSIEITRIGIRLIGVYDNGLKFPELAELMQSKIYPPEPNKLFEITSKKYKDVSFAAVYEKDDQNIRLQAGPVTRDEILDRTQFNFTNIEKLDFPESSLFFDIDISKNHPKNPKQMLSFVDRSKNILQNAQNFLDFLEITN